MVTLWRKVFHGLPQLTLVKKLKNSVYFDITDIGIPHSSVVHLKEQKMWTN